MLRVYHVNSQVPSTLNEQSLFLRALEQPAGEPRQRWLEQACEDPGQRTRIASLLERHEKAGSFLDSPPAELLEQKDADRSAKPKPITKSKFVDRLIRSKLMTAEEAAACDSNLESLQAAPDALSYAHAMVKANKLTGFQAKAICDGRIKGLTFGEYIILDRLGKGGMGIVYKAKHRRMDRLVAIKVLPRSTMATKGLEDRFYREVQTAAKLMHPNIVAALDASEDDGLHYLVMEYVDGQDLGEVLRQSGPLQSDHAVNCIIQAARGLQYAHEQGVIHRDIKPANLLIDGSGTVKVLDMGLARVTGAASEGLDESTGRDSSKEDATLSWEQDTATISDQTQLTKAGEIMGTLDYMPPEQFTDSRNVDQRGDIYSLGCTLFHLLTGQKPFPAGTVAAIFKSHLNDPVPTLRSVRPDIPEHLDRVFQKMLTKEPKQRQGSMSQVIEELEQSLAEMQSPQTSLVGELQNVSNNRVLHANTFDLASSVNPAGSPQIILSHDQPVRRGRRNRLGWIPVGVAACSLLLIAVLMFAQKVGQGERRMASSGNVNSLKEANSMPEGARMTSRQHPPGNTNGKPSAGGADPGMAKPENEAQHPSDETAQDLAMGVMPTKSAEDSIERDNAAEQLNQNDVDIDAQRPMDWIDGTTWASRFGIQGGPAFGPTGNRQVQFIDNGRKVSISEDSTGITVSVDGRVVEAANPAELSKKDAQAFQLYEKVFGITDQERAPAISAFELQRMQLERLRDTHSKNPQLKSLIESMLPDNSK